MKCSICPSTQHYTNLYAMFDDRRNIEYAATVRCEDCKAGTIAFGKSAQEAVDKAIELYKAGFSEEEAANFNALREDVHKRAVIIRDVTGMKVVKDVKRDEMFPAKKH